jgi:PAS domain S-box-containing protein
MSNESVKFLLVDDLEENLLALEALLRREGLKLLKARSGAEALELLLVHDFALALLDVQMPGMNGFELAELMRGTERTRRVPIIFLTAVATDERRRFGGYEAGAVDFLIKPIDPQALRSKAEVFYELYRQRQEVIRQRDELRASEERLRLALEAAIAGSFDWDLSTNRVVWSAEQYEMLGYKPFSFEPTYESWRSRVHPDDIDRVEAEVAEAIRQRRDIDMVYRIIGADGETRWVNGRRHNFYDQAGRAVRQVGVMIDITDRKRAEEERERLLAREHQAREQAEAATRAKDEFLAIVSHELRSPLNAILGYNRMLREKPKDSESLKKSCDTIERNARMQLQLIEDLLDSARIISGKLRLEIGPIDIASVVNDALDVVRMAAEAKGVKLCAKLDPEQEMITGDAARLQQVIWNLLSNAIKFTPECGRVELKVERDAERVRIIVSDTGRGINAELLPYVFDRFRQSDNSASRRQGGLGLGLALVKSLVELHGGEVKAESDGEGRGATFTVTLPLATHSRMAVAEPPALAARACAIRVDDAIPLPDEAPLAGVRALVVDDQEEARVTLSNFLSECGAVITTVSSGAEALKVLSDPPGGARLDVLVCDIAMPDEDGYATLRRVRALEHERGMAPSQQIPAIALTAMAQSEDRLRALGAGFKMHVAKPVEPAELVVVIASVVEQSRLKFEFENDSPKNSPLL